ncbi:hypothetical protein [Actinomyces wuliandei]|uniref:hypothetical protein n=1 Tax=Actinomyces wuliandei TaxID=2057743 RepID=UPI00111966C4|nr:hypothetical protein [Actinomyces wuliandei]
MVARVLAITRTGSDEEAAAAREPFEGVAEVELVEVGRRDASALISGLSTDYSPIWIYPLGEGMIVAVGSPGPLVRRLRADVAHRSSGAPGSRADEEERVGLRPEVVLAVAVAALRTAQARTAEARMRLSRAEVLERISGRVDELHPVTQVSRLNRRLNTPQRPPTLTRNEDNNYA